MSNWASYTVLTIFIVNLIFYLIMSIISPYYQHLNSKGLGKAFNIIWLVLIAISFGILAFYHTACVSGLNPKDGVAVAQSIFACDLYVYMIIATLVSITIPFMIWSIVADLRYRRQLKSQTTQEGR